MLGPVPCQGCGTAVIWTGHRWRAVGQRGNSSHRCEPVTRCGAWMPQAKERCCRSPRHRHEHRTAYALENAARARRAYSSRDGISITPPHEMARLPLIPVEVGPSQPQNQGGQ
jgi:hypothetical protein